MTRGDTDPGPGDSALDLLETEDMEVRDLFDQLQATRGPSVDDRADHGILAKQLIRHVATREAALDDVARALSDTDLRPLAERIASGMTERRQHIDRVEHMSRGIQGINLNAGQDFEGELQALIDVLRPEIAWELDEAIPMVRRHLDEGDDLALHGAHRVATHAPTSLSPTGPKWYERAPVVGWLLTVYTRLRDFPAAGNDVPRTPPAAADEAQIPPAARMRSASRWRGGVDDAGPAAGQLGRQVVADGDRPVERRRPRRDAARQRLDDRLDVAVVEEGHRTATGDPAVDHRRDHPVHGRQPPLVGPTGGEVTQIDEERPRDRTHVVPHPVVVEHLEAGSLVGPQHGDDAEVGVGPHADGRGLGGLGALGPRRSGSCATPRWRGQ